MFAEALPALVIQSVALLKSDNRSRGAIASLLISACSTGLISTTMAYDKDVSPVSRKESPDAYGFVPNAGRGLAFVTMLALSTLHIIAKTMANALLVVTNPTWLLYYMSSDLGFYFIQKLLRRDFIYWMPLPLSLSIPAALIFRVCTKIVTDFTGCLLFKHPYELGGAYFSFNLMTTQISVPVIGYLYHKHYDGEDKIDETLTWVTVATLLVLWFVIFTFLIFYVIVPSYRKTFFSFQTGFQMSQSYFIDNEGDDATRTLIFTTSVAHWKGIENEVREWTNANWRRWEDDKPAWFTPFVIASIPDSYIPVEAIRALGGANRVRRGSASLAIDEADLHRRLSFSGEARVEDGGVN
jgi:hypothetical protein